MRPKNILLVVGVLVALAVAFVIGRQASRPTAEPAATVTAVPADAPETHAPPAGPQIDAIRRGVALDQEKTPPPLARVENTDIKRVRDYPMQPPTIPHSIDNYQISKNTNRCMLCHSRANADKFQAPPISVTHYMDRDMQFLATVSPRRYFCNQCHVVQTDAKPLVGNQFEDIDSVLARQRLTATPGK